MIISSPSRGSSVRFDDQESESKKYALFETCQFTEFKLAPGECGATGEANGPRQEPQIRLLRRPNAGMSNSGQTGCESCFYVYLIGP